MSAATAAETNLSLHRAIIICALGYFIDVFDIQLFAVLRVPSLTDLGVSADKLSVIGGYILNAQMLGMVLGAFLWGWLGDRFGRLKALYGSILVYSIGTLACSFVGGPIAYGVLRFFAGFGLSGETGAAITLISELIAPKKRGWGIALISGVGAMGPVVATVISMVIPWRITYVVAGVLGLLLFILRVRLSEPDIYRNMNVEKTTRGSLALLFQRNQRRIFLFCIILGLFSSYCWFLLNFFSAEFSGSVLAAGEVFNQKICLICFYFGTCIGTLFWNSLSQWLANRRKAVISVLVLGVVTCSYYLIVAPQTKVTASQLYMIYLLIGICGGCWALLNTIAAEHFGTNIRATATLLVANFLRAFSIPMILIFQILRNYMTLTNSAALIGMVLFMAGFVAISQLRETHGLDLDYVEALKTSPERS